jgi:hypothetical protein
MSYFNMQIGERPIDEPDESNQLDKSSLIHKKELPYFAASLGACPAKPDRQAQSGDARNPHAEDIDPLTRSPAHPLTPCPLCRGPLEGEQGVYRCAGRCGARWLEESPGRLIDLAALPLGICACCRPPRALVRGERGAVCPASGDEYVLLPTSPLPLDVAAPEGLCLCCAPPSPLARQDGALVCVAKPHNHYQRQGGTHVTLAPPSTPTTAAALAAIDTALRRNTAKLTVNGLFDLD